MNDLTVLMFDVIPYLNDKNIPFSTERLDKGWISTKCLFCSDTGEHMGININSNFISCWKCSAKGSVTKIVKEIEKTISYPETLEIMEKYQNFNRIGLINTSEETNPKVPYLKMPPNYIKLSWPKVPDIVIKFLISRGFDPETMVRNKELYYGGFVGPFKFRLILPVTFRGQLVSYLGRDISGKSSIKYKNLDDSKSVISIKNTLYGFDEAPPGSNIVVTEGPLDVIKLGAGAVATYGTAWTTRQVTLLRELNPNSITILYDSEIEAQKSAKRLSREIWFSNCDVVQLNKFKDPGELSVEEGKKLMMELRGRNANNI